MRYSLPSLRCNTPSAKAGQTWLALLLGGLGSGIAPAAFAHVEYYDLNQGVQIADLTASGKLAAQAQYAASAPQDLALNNPAYWTADYETFTTGGAFSGTQYGEFKGGSTVAVSDVTDFGWGAGTQATLGDSHKVDFFNFRLQHASQVSISWLVSAGSSFIGKALSRPPVEIIQPEASCDFLIRSSDGRYIEMASAY